MGRPTGGRIPEVARKLTAQPASDGRPEQDRGVVVGQSVPMGDRDESRPGPEPLPRTPLELVSGGRDATAGQDGSDELCLPASTSSARTARHWVMNELAAEGVFGA